MSRLNKRAIVSRASGRGPRRANHNLLCSCAANLCKHSLERTEVSVNVTDRSDSRAEAEAGGGRMRRLVRQRGSDFLKNYVCAFALLMSLENSKSNGSEHFVNSMPAMVCKSSMMDG